MGIIKKISLFTAFVAIGAALSAFPAENGEVSPQVSPYYDYLMNPLKFQITYFGNQK